MVALERNGTQFDHYYCSSIKNKLWRKQQNQKQLIQIIPVQLEMVRAKGEETHLNLKASKHYLKTNEAGIPCFLCLFVRSAVLS